MIRTKVRTAHLCLLLALLLAACQPIQALPATQTTTTGSAATKLEAANQANGIYLEPIPIPVGAITDPAINQAVVQRFYEEVVNKKHLDGFKEVFDPNMKEHALGFGPQLFRDTDLFAGFPDLHLKVDLLVVKDDLVTAVVTVTGTQTGNFIGLAPTGKKVTWSQIDVWRVQHGKITDVWHNFASADILQQVGYQLMPPTK